MSSIDSMTIGVAITEALRSAARAYVPGDQVPPAAVLWLDPDHLWSSVVNELIKTMPDLFALGPYTPAEHRGPALWLRCVEGRTVPESPAPGTTPIFYLPNVTLDHLRDLESIASDLAPLAELQYRGTLWLHPNGKEWTPLAFLISKKRGLSKKRGRVLQSHIAPAQASISGRPTGNPKANGLPGVTR